MTLGRHLILQGQGALVICLWHSRHKALLLLIHSLLYLPLAATNRTARQAAAVNVWQDRHKALLLHCYCTAVARQALLLPIVTFWTRSTVIVKIGHTLEGWRNGDVLMLVHLVVMVYSIQEQ